MRESPIQDYSAYGRQRDSFCRALAAKASRAVDENGTLRSASYASTGALLLLEFLLSCEEALFLSLYTSAKLTLHDLTFDRG